MDNVSLMQSYDNYIRFVEPLRLIELSVCPALSGIKLVVFVTISYFHYDGNPGFVKENRLFR